MTAPQGEKWKAVLYRRIVACLKRHTVITLSQISANLRPSCIGPGVRSEMSCMNGGRASEEGEEWALDAGRGRQD